MFNCFLTALDSTLSADKEEYLVTAIKHESSRRLIAPYLTKILVRVKQ